MLTPEHPARVLLVDDQALFRKGIAAVLVEANDIEVVASVDNGLEAIEKAADLHPDIVLMDVRMPHSSGISAARAIKEEDPGCRILMLTMSDDQDDLAEAFEAGADGYLMKDTSIHDVAEAIRNALDG